MFGSLRASGLPGRRRHRPASVLAALAATALFGVGLTVAGTSPAAAAVPGPPSGWTTVFSDDFAGASGTGVDTGKWKYDTGPGSSFGTGEIETMTNSTSNVHLDGNGHLNITRPAQRQRLDLRPHPDNQRERRRPGRRQAGGHRLDPAAHRRPGLLAGVLDARARGQWPENGEIDIMEDVNALSKHSGTMHCGTDPGGPCNETNGIGSGLQACSGCQTGYHTYTVIVDRTNSSQESVTLYLDGARTSRSPRARSDRDLEGRVRPQVLDHLRPGHGRRLPERRLRLHHATSATTSGSTMTVQYVAA